jgi:hypothetical protein
MITRSPSARVAVMVSAESQYEMDFLLPEPIEPEPTLPPRVPHWVREAQGVKAAIIQWLEQEC